MYWVRNGRVRRVWFTAAAETYSSRWLYMYNDPNSIQINAPCMGHTVTRRNWPRYCVRTWWVSSDPMKLVKSLMDWLRTARTILFISYVRRACRRIYSANAANENTACHLARRLCMTLPQGEQKNDSGAVHTGVYAKGFHKINRLQCSMTMVRGLKLAELTNCPLCSGIKRVATLGPSSFSSSFSWVTGINNVATFSVC